MSKVQFVALDKGRFALIDVEDFEKASALTWFLDSDNKYVVANLIVGTGKYPKRKRINLHRFILNPPSGTFVDHINGNPLDNRRANLRLATITQNSGNIGAHSRNKSGFKGVSPSKWGKRKYGEARWTAQICINKKRTHLGTFFDKRTAALAYNNAAEKHFGEFARLNELRGVLRDPAS